MTHSNCLLFSLALKVRRGSRGRLRYRQSKFGWFPHFFYAEKHHIVSYTPDNPRRKTCPPPLFAGHVTWGD